MQVDRVSRERGRTPNHVLEPQDGFLGGLLPPAVLEVEHEGEGLGGVGIVGVVDGDLASSDVNIQNAGESQVQVVERVHLALTLGAGPVRADVQALDLHAHRNEKPKVKAAAAVAPLARYVSRRYMVDVGEGIQKRRREAELRSQRFKCPGRQA